MAEQAMPKIRLLFIVEMAGGCIPVNRIDRARFEKTDSRRVLEGRLELCSAG
jgi:hypothetical protein